MSTIRYQTESGYPVTPNKVYLTHLKDARTRFPRWWDGTHWWDISIRKGIPFDWPKDSEVRSYYPENSKLYLRKISVQGIVRYVTPYTFYEPNEVLRYMVSIGEIPVDWKTCYQDQMRLKKFK